MGRGLQPTIPILGTTASAATASSCGDGSAASQVGAAAWFVSAMLWLQTVNSCQRQATILSGLPLERLVTSL